MPEQVPERRLVKKLAEVMGKVERIPKTGKNQHFNYRFAQEADVLDAIRGPLAEAHVMLLPSVVTHEVREAKTNQGGVLYVTVLRVRLTFIDGETGETQAIEVIGEGQDSQDKGAAKAMTAAIKQGLLKTFLVPTGDDPDKDGPAKARPPPAPAGAAPSARTAEPPTRDQLQQLRALVGDVEREGGKPRPVDTPKTLTEARDLLATLRAERATIRRSQWPLPISNDLRACEHEEHAHEKAYLTEQEWISTVEQFGRPLCKTHARS